MPENVHRIAPSTTVSLVRSQCGILWDQDLETPAVYPSSRSVSDCAGHRVAGDTSQFAALLVMMYKWFVISELQVSITTVIGRKDPTNGRLRWGFRPLSPPLNTHIRGLKTR